ncbi:hypothetical protein COCC4DRAFT_129775 [Bipolaris maydis ATCC 48331]|uniref:F-box domain-containing protein n=2 Tax=Cochliobolus heterostrophus TaxID=5016 RepID=M2UWP0_COCH5|nr:uncharacterized protein COCC4DRAFT_129775 [Bipolaris maydis ATCC 48331]EMD92222.1 hypothetical protein COCHEDRAFT_1224095 [Bipolaris maydis C5]KAJ5022078.1 hypothetical protein J3E73DRAFT_239433 [Bipolaris maydis]ENI07916.1 hypothetical protein COCC4DRAFT_129775 [Bipolaris maydis ATCC 48331]KAJ6197899.1 hypothetical protein J3E72DRAFT_240489 [Bipolaris maydis]KAJ6210026.1 hypothetical protein PSV09DRAFT_1224095 [Bipolaris maydis]
MASASLSSANSRLPNELALLVIDHLEGSNKALCALAQTCRSMQHLAEERLYKTVELLSVKNLHAIISAFTLRRERIRAVQTLKILYQYQPGDLKDSDELRATFNECVADMVNLRDWHIESPYDNFHWEGAGGEAWVEGDMQRFRRALDTACAEGPREADNILAEQRLGKHVERTVGLALLERLTIHSHGADTDFWEFNGFHCLFQHPTLRHLHVSCVAFPDAEIPQLATHVGKTPLTSLYFDECELQPKSLLSILRTPARLKSLTLGENVFNVNRSRGAKPILSRDPGASLKALSAVAHSLERLTHLDPGWHLDTSPHVFRSVRPPGDGMRNFHALDYMECDTTSFLHTAIVMNRDLAPPQLQTLRIRRHWDVPVDFWDHPPDFDHYAALPSLDTLELMQSSYIWLDLSEPSYICNPESLRNRHAKAYKLFKAGINLRMLIELHKSPSLIPPYLHNERVPVVHCVYDADEVGFHRHVVNPGDIVKFGVPPPETDQLGDLDIGEILINTRRDLHRLRHKFVRPGRRLPFMDMFDTDEEADGLAETDDDFEVDDLEEDDDMELDLELDADDGFTDDESLQFFEHDGEFYVTMYETATEDEDEEEEEMHDAVENQQTHPNDVD